MCLRGALRFVAVMHCAHSGGAGHRCAPAMAAAAYRVRVEFP